MVNPGTTCVNEAEHFTSDMKIASFYLLSDSGSFRALVKSWKGGPGCRVSCELSGFHYQASVCMSVPASSGNS